MSADPRVTGRGQRVALPPAARRSLPARRGTLGSLLRAAVLLFPVTGLTGCEWFTDFKRQPSVVTWESWRPDSLGVRGSPQGSVPTVGTAMAAFSVSYAPLPATIDSMAGIPNPVPVSEASLARGRMLFQINCAVCHGDTGNGQPVGMRYGIFVWPLTSDAARQRTDGYIFGMIRNGRTNMPSYNRIEERDRWDVVNYVRALQGLITGVPFGTGPLAPPGVTGDKLPGATELGPTRAIPYQPAAARTGGAQ